MARTTPNRLWSYPDFEENPYDTTIVGFFEAQDADVHTLATAVRAVSLGGTGQSTLTAGAYLKGNGTSAVSVQAVPIPQSDGGTGLTTLTSAITNTMLRTSAVTTVMGNPTGVVTNPGDIQATQDGQVLRRVSGTNLGFGPLNLAGGANAVTGLLPADNISVSVPRLLWQLPARIGNPASTAWTALGSYTLPANTLVTTGQEVVYHACFATGNNADAKEILISVGGTTISYRNTSGADDVIDISFVMRRVSANNQEITATMFGTGNFSSAVLGMMLSRVTTTHSETGTILIKADGRSVATAVADNTVQTHGAILLRG